MSIVAVVNDEKEAVSMTRWAWHFATARQIDVIIIHPVFVRLKDGQSSDDFKPNVEETHPGGVPLSGDDVIFAASSTAHYLTHDHLAADTAKREAAGLKPAACPTFILKRIEHHNTVQAVLDVVKDTSGEVLLLSYPEQAKVAPEVYNEIDGLFEGSPCDTILLRLPESVDMTCQKILVPTTGGTHASEAVRLASGIAEAENGKVDALYVQADIGLDAAMLGRKAIDRHIRKAVGTSPSYVFPRVEVDNQFKLGLKKVLEDPYDLMVVGVSGRSAVRRHIKGCVPKHILTQPLSSGKDGEHPMTVAIVRDAIPLGKRTTEWVREVIDRSVPQLTREGRIDLMDRVQVGSSWNFDYIALIALSTMICAFGLLNNSAAVVIGAMLIAPLMTPLIGCGLALAQGNIQLIHNGVRAVVFGFLLAFAIGFLSGVIAPGEALTSEVMARGAPNLLDLMIAIGSGIAAAYAMSRPNLSSALPGVAIAAALVPPIASSGIALAHGDWVIALGAGMLFFTNIVTIVVGAAIALYLVGITPSHTHGRDRPWIKKVATALTMLTIVLAVPLTYLLYARLPVGVDAMSDDLQVLLADVQQVIRDADSNAMVVSIDAEMYAMEVMSYEVTLDSEEPVSRALQHEMLEQLRTSLGDEVHIRILNRLVTSSHSLQSVGELE